MFDISFWKDFLSNFLATLLGAILGVPLGLLVNEIQLRNNEKDEQKKNDELAIFHLKEIIELLEIELNYNKGIFNSFSPRTVYTEDSFDNLYHVANKATSEVWKSLSEGGRIKWIKDNSLLVAIAWAYYSITQVSLTGKPLIEFTYYSAPRSGKVIAERIQLHFKVDIERAITSIELALQKIDEFKDTKNT